MNRFGATPLWVWPSFAILPACAPPPKAPAREAESVITAEALLAHITTLSSDRFEGRAPGTPGEELSVEYLKSEMKKAGLAPGNPDGTWEQAVPMVGISSQSVVAIDDQDLRQGEECVAWSFRDGTGDGPDVRISKSELVFGGYGLIAPEKNRNDFAQDDVRGKTVVFLVGDPFGGPMTYYGRWTYKFETAMKLGAAAALIVHETGPAGYGWNVVAGGSTHDKYEIDTPEARNGHVAAEGWMTEGAARKLMPDFDALKAAAAKADFRPVPLPHRASFFIANRRRHIVSRNVIGRVVGSDLKDEHVVYSAHWDHFGKNDAGVFHGALDNAAGVASILETARAFTSLPTPPRRSILFLSTTAEESGLIGAKYYAEHPLYPMKQTVADINFDIPNPWGRTKSIVSLSLGLTTMDATLAEEAAKQGRRVVPDPQGEKGYFFRSDHFEFVKHGVPALGFLFPGGDLVNASSEAAKLKRQDYVAHRYHTPNDVIAADWDLTGMVDDTVLLFRVGRRIANDDRAPEWNPSAAFRR